MTAIPTLSGARCQYRRVPSRRAARPASVAHTFFVDSQASPGGVGTEASPFDTIGAALAVAQPGAVIRVRAPESRPQRERIAPDVDVRITAWDYDAGSGDTTFHIRASDEFKGGWTSLGGGIYSRSWSSGQLRTVVVMSITNERGTPIVLDRERGTTSPSEGAFAYVGGMLYVHLPEGASANSHTIEVDTANTGDGSHDATILVEGVTVQLDGVIALVGRNAAIRADAEGVILARDCDAGLSVTGWNTGATGRMDLTRCRGYGTRNDGFNDNATTGYDQVLTDCEFFDNADEGVSPHAGNRIDMSGGRCHHNGGGGFLGVNGSEYHLVSVELDNNALAMPSSAVSAGGVGWPLGCTGSAAFCNARDNNGRGFAYDCASTEPPLLSNNTSTGNTLPDTGCGV